MNGLVDIPGYDVDGRLGSGGMGVVYSATHLETGRRRAVKVLCDRSRRFEDLARFHIEAQAYACVDHPHIVRIRAIGVAHGWPYLATDLAENGSLDDYLNEHPDVSLEWRVDSLARVADAVHHAHTRTILHRDLKPANILVDAELKPLVTDFGLGKFGTPRHEAMERHGTISGSMMMVEPIISAMLRDLKQEEQADHAHAGSHETAEFVREMAQQYTQAGVPEEAFDYTSTQNFLRQSFQQDGETLIANETKTKREEEFKDIAFQTQAGAICGTPNYMAPEQAVPSSLITHKRETDVYGLGATLYHVVTGHVPTTGGSVSEVLQCVQETPPVHPTAWDATIPDDLCLVIMKALEKRPEDRYASMKTLARELDRVLAGKPVLARKDANHTHTRDGRLIPTSLILQDKCENGGSSFFIGSTAIGSFFRKISTFIPKGRQRRDEIT